MVTWEFLFFNKSVYEKDATFINALINIFFDYIPNQFLTIDYKDSSTQRLLTKKNKNKIIHKTLTYKS